MRRVASLLLLRLVLRLNGWRAEARPWGLAFKRPDNKASGPIDYAVASVVSDLVTLD